MMRHTRIPPVAHQVGHTFLRRHSHKIQVTGAVFCTFFWGEWCTPKYPDVSPTWGRGLYLLQPRIIDLISPLILPLRKWGPDSFQGLCSAIKLAVLCFFLSSRWPFPMVCFLFVFFWYQSVFLLLQSGYVIEWRHHMLLMMVLMMLFFSLNIHCLHFIWLFTCHLSHTLL